MVATAKAAHSLHQELFALVLSSETLERVDVTKALRGRSNDTEAFAEVSGLCLMDPVLDLIRAGSTRCTSLVLDGNMLTLRDIDHLGASS
jgi:hypothetical protein